MLNHDDSACPKKVLQDRRDALQLGDFGAGNCLKDILETLSGPEFYDLLEFKVFQLHPEASRSIRAIVVLLLRGFARAPKVLTFGFSPGPSHHS